MRRRVLIAWTWPQFVFTSAAGYMLGQGGGGSGGERPSFPTTWLLLKIGLFTFTSCVKQRIFEIYMRLLPKIGLGGSCPSRIPSSLGLGSEASLASCYLIWNRLNWYWCIDEVNSFTNRLSEFVNHRPSGMSTKWTHRLNGYRPSEPIDQVGCRPSESSIKWDRSSEPIDQVGRRPSGTPDPIDQMGCRYYG